MPLDILVQGVNPNVADIEPGDESMTTVIDQVFSINVDVSLEWLEKAIP